MAQVKLSVPSERIQQFQQATALEIARDARAVEENAEAVPRTIASSDLPGTGAEDLHGSARLLGETLAVGERVFAEGAESVEVESDSATLAHICETMARDVVAPQLMDGLQVCPLDVGASRGVTKMMRALNWATDHAVEYHAHASTAVWKSHQG
jgi:hypothetical protein